MSIEQKIKKNGKREIVTYLVILDQPTKINENSL